MADQTLSSLPDYEHAARPLLEGRGSLFGRLGDSTWQTATANRIAFDAIRIRPRVLTGNKQPSLRTTLLGDESALPLILGPSGGHQRLHREGELATARAAGSAGIIMTVSTVATFSIEEIAAAATGPLWLQLYFLKDRDVTLSLVRRAEAAGYKAIALTVDNIASRLSAEQRRLIDKSYGSRESAETRNLDPGRLLRNLADYPGLQRLGVEKSIMHLVESDLSWADVDWLRASTSLPIIIKGILDPEDARLAVEHGASAIMVSNHGGVPFEMEGVQSSIEALPDVVEAVDNRIAVYVDGGVRNGKDILAALALGAQAVLIGRPVQWGLAVDGEAGVRNIIDILHRELATMMGVAGVADVNHVPRGTIDTRTRTGLAISVLREIHDPLRPKAGNAS